MFHCPKKKLRKKYLTAWLNNYDNEIYNDTFTTFLVPVLIFQFEAANVCRNDYYLTLITFPIHSCLNQLSFIYNENIILQSGILFLTAYQIYAKYTFNQLISMSSIFEATENFLIKMRSLVSVLLSSIDYTFILYFFFLQRTM